MLGRVIDWIFDGSASCARLRCANAAAVEVLHHEVMEERRKKWDQIEKRERAQVCCGQLSERVDALQEERDGLIRELIMERMRMADMRQKARDQHTSRERCIVELRRRVNEVRALAQDERQQRIAATAELANCRELLRREMAVCGLLKSRVEHLEQERAAQQELRKEGTSNVQHPTSNIEGGSEV